METPEPMIVSDDRVTPERGNDVHTLKFAGPAAQPTCPTYESPIPVIKAKFAAPIVGHDYLAPAHRHPIQAVELVLFAGTLLLACLK